MSGGAEGFAIGDVVRLEGLVARQAFNQHVGQVVAHNPGGRVGVHLHGCLWGACSGRHDPIGIKPENIRRVRAPDAAEEPLTCMGCPPRWACVKLCVGWGLPEHVAEDVADKLLVKRVGEVRIDCASSQRGDYPLQEVLNDNDRTWWISGEEGLGNEWLQFSFGKPCRVSFIGMKIPPLPQGPLSVRDFHLEVLNPDQPELSDTDDSESDDARWVRKASYTTLDLGCLQEFAIVPPLEVQLLRLVFTKNAAADGEEASMMRCVGLFQVAFK